MYSLFKAFFDISDVSCALSC